MCSDGIAAEERREKAVEQSAVVGAAEFRRTAAGTGVDRLLEFLWMQFLESRLNIGLRMPLMGQFHGRNSGENSPRKKRIPTSIPVDATVAAWSVHAGAYAYCC